MNALTYTVPNPGVTLPSPLVVRDVIGLVVSGGAALPDVVALGLVPGAPNVDGPGVMAIQTGTFVPLVVDRLEIHWWNSAPTAALLTIITAGGKRGI